MINNGGAAVEEACFLDCHVGASWS